MTVDTSARLAALRACMKKNVAGQGPIDALMVPHDDNHLTEYTADTFSRLEYISGFSGSAGSAIITDKGAWLWTDGRYHLQASEQLDSNWTLMKFGLPGVPTDQEYLIDSIPASKVGVDPYCTSYEKYCKLEKAVKAAKHTLVPVWKNLIDEIWVERPPMPKDKIFVLPKKFAGVSWQDKVKQVREDMATKHCDWLAATSLDDIAWLLNLRGSDVEQNPVFYSYTLIGPDSVTLYIDLGKLDDEVRSHLKGVEVKPYEDVNKDLVAMSAALKRLWVGPKCSYAIASQVDEDKLYTAETPMTILKAIKNKVELEGAYNCQVRDGAALCIFLHWLEGQVKAKAVLDEVDAADQLLKMREAQEHFISTSFTTISSMGPNGAIIHYAPSKPTAALITDESLYLVDSGGQYLDGTTDTTRTVHFGTPTDYHRYCYTLVLKGHIALATTVFPNGISGHRLDCIARLAMWKCGLDYLHGTGHGIGAFLNVHEGPQSITHKGGGVGDYPMKAGMVTSNEPGYYEAGAFGARIENVMVTVPKETPHNFAQLGFLGFDTTTVAPLAHKLVDVSMLTAEELKWANDYNAMVVEKVGPLLDKQGKKDVLEWLKNECRPL